MQKNKLNLAELKLPMILLAEIILCLAFGDMIPTYFKGVFYAISLLLKEVLVVLLPFIIFSILFSSLGNLQKGALSFAALAFSMVILSNFVSTSLGGFFGMQFLNFIDIAQHTTNAIAPLEPLWHAFLSPNNPDSLAHFWGFKILKLVTNDMALFSGIACGLALAFADHAPTKKVAHGLKNCAFAFFQKIFIPLIPLFILGYILNMEHSGILASIFQNYLIVIAVILVLAYGYIVFLYGAATLFNLSKWQRSMRNIFPAMLTGFSTMSSASALPLLIEGVRKNTTNEASPGVVPISVNIHLVGDCFGISILALAIMVSFGHPLPTVQEFMIFTVFFVLAKFAVAAVPGGGILVMLPILEKYLGFTPEMLSLITALYILFDPIVTSANVFGNGVFAQLFEKVYLRIHKQTLNVALKKAP